MTRRMGKRLWAAGPVLIALSLAVAATGCGGRIEEPIGRQSSATTAGTWWFQDPQYTTWSNLYPVGTWTYFGATNQWSDTDIPWNVGSLVRLPEDSQYQGDVTVSICCNGGGTATMHSPYFIGADGHRFFFNHLQSIYVSGAGTWYNGGAVIGATGGNTCQTGYEYACTGALISSGAHFCIEVADNYTDKVFPPNYTPTTSCKYSNGSSGYANVLQSTCGPSCSGLADGSYCYTTSSGTIESYSCVSGAVYEVATCANGCTVGKGCNNAVVNVAVSAGAGTVGVSRNGASIGSTSSTSGQAFGFNIGDSYTFTATPSSGATFIKFCGDAACSITTTSNPFSGTITTSSGNVFAYFTAPCAPSCNGGWSCGASNGCGGTCPCPDDNTDEYASGCMASGANTACTAYRSYDGYVEERYSNNCPTRWSRYTCNYPPCNGTVRVDRNSPYFTGNPRNYSFGSAGSTYSSQIDHGPTYCVAWSYNSPWAPGTIGCSN